MKQTRDILKTYFETGDFPTEVQFAELIDSYAHLNEFNFGLSINLTQFWEARNTGKSIEEAAFETFTGQWAKQNGFKNIYIENVKKDIRPEKVLIKFLKE